MYTDPSITPEGHVNEDYHESTVDIYVSTESLKVYENPWVEATSPNTPGPGETQHPGMEETGLKKKNHTCIVYVLFCTWCFIEFDSLVLLFLFNGI